MFKEVIYQWIRGSHEFVDANIGNGFQEGKQYISRMFGECSKGGTNYIG